MKLSVISAIILSVRLLGAAARPSGAVLHPRQVGNPLLIDIDSATDQEQKALNNARTLQGCAVGSTGGGCGIAPVCYASRSIVGSAFELL